MNEQSQELTAAVAAERRGVSTGSLLSITNSKDACTNSPKSTTSQNPNNSKK